MRRLGALLVVAATVAALAVVSSAGAAEKPSLADDVAARLGVSADALRQAFRDALDARIDAAVDAGRLTPERAAKLKERLANAKGLGLRIRDAFARHHRPLVPRMRVAAHGLRAAAHYLGLTVQELRSELRDGKSLAQVAEAHGKSVEGLVDALLGRAAKRLDAAVEHGRLTRARADEILARLEDRVEDLVQRAHAAR